MTDEVLEAFRDEAEALDSVVEKLSADDFRRPTNCPPWDVKELIVHIAVVLPPYPLRVADSSTPDITEPADYYRRPDRTRPDYHGGIAARAVETAAEIADGAAAGRLLAERWRTAWRDWSERDLSGLVTLSVGTSRLDDYIVTRVISHAAHGLDLALSLGVEPWTTGRALAVMRPVFVSLLGAEPPTHWSDQALFERATGRRGLDREDRAALGACADRWPLLS
ncbi:maleylpyruvate isomerase N-terminal domain-containing protein [Actinopolymorpha sp. B17G11]|uniref:maleylpyruvate isomerase N-terminal domain-containing protein n=1 Tax=unclassified Actinopolymorpha TaxID=2627063 RepID=UPI0032D968B3